MRNGEEDENIVQKHFEGEGYVVLNPNEKGFPDLIVVKGRKIIFFVEVKGCKETKPFVPDSRKQIYESLKKKLGVETKCINVNKDGNLEPYT